MLLVPCHHDAGCHCGETTTTCFCRSSMKRRVYITTSILQQNSGRQTNGFSADKTPKSRSTTWLNLINVQRSTKLVVSLFDVGAACVLQRRQTLRDEAIRAGRGKRAVWATRRAASVDIRTSASSRDGRRLASPLFICPSLAVGLRPSRPLGGDGCNSSPTTPAVAPV